MKQVWPGDVERQPWHHRDAPVVRLFDRAMETGDLATAWTVLNGTGWSVADAQRSIRRLVEGAADPQFARHAEAWIAISSDQRFGDAY